MQTATTQQTGTRREPVTSFGFHVQVGNISQAVFTECSGLQAEVQVEEYFEGGMNSTVHKLPSRAKFGNVTLRRGVCCSDELVAWWKSVLRGNVSRKDVSIVLYNQKGEEVTRWTLADAFPVKWVAPQLRASDSTAAIEALELTYQELRY